MTGGIQDGTKLRTSPSPSGRRWREAPDEGVLAGVGYPHRRFAAPSPKGRGNSLKQVSIFEEDVEVRFHLPSRLSVDKRIEHEKNSLRRATRRYVSRIDSAHPRTGARARSVRQTDRERGSGGSWQDDIH